MSSRNVLPVTSDSRPTKAGFCSQQRSRNGDGTGSGTLRDLCSRLTDWESVGRGVKTGFGLGFQYRERARELHLPVLMQTSDRGLLDVERFDLAHRVGPGRLWVNEETVAEAQTPDLVDLRIELRPMLERPARTANSQPSEK